MFWINFKTYPQGTADDAEQLAHQMQQLENSSGVVVRPVCQALDVYRISQHYWDWVWCQHADNVQYGAHTGWTLPEGIKRNGAQGVMLNHAEHKLGAALPETVKRVRAVGLSFGLCADGIEELKSLTKFQPDWLAYEPPELIGNPDISVASAKPAVVQEAVKIAGEIPLLIGAGVHSPADIKTGKQLGAAGFLIASAVMKADQPIKKLTELVTAWTE